MMQPNAKIIAQPNSALTSILRSCTGTERQRAQTVIRHADLVLLYLQCTTCFVAIASCRNHADL
jgi:hypothetical protein